MIRNLAKCSKCKEEYKPHILKRIHGEWICSKCYSKFRKEKRKVLKEELLSLGLTYKRRSSEEVAKERAINNQLKMKQVTVGPKIRGAKKVKAKYKNLGMYLSMGEKQFLFRKYLKRYGDEEVAIKKILNITVHLKNIVKNLKEENKKPEEIKDKFRKEFERLCQ